jgi:site-specific DNA recombinase
LRGRAIDLLEDEHRLRRLTGTEEAEQLRSMFNTARLLAAELQHRSRLEKVIRSLVYAVQFAKDHMAVTIHLGALNCPGAGALDISMPLPARKPFREAKLRIDSAPTSDSKPDEQLLKLLADAAEAQRLVLASPELSLNALGKREGRCRTQLSRLLRLSWLSPRIVEMIAAGAQPRGLTRARLLSDELPMDWAEQEQLLGGAAR